MLITVALGDLILEFLVPVRSPEWRLHPPPYAWGQRTNGCTGTLQVPRPLLPPYSLLPG